MGDSEAAARHVLVLYDGSDAARRALAAAASITGERRAALTVVSLVAHERESGGCCCVPGTTWNRELDTLADEQVQQARVLLRAHGCVAHFAIVEGSGGRAIRSSADEFGCDLVMVPAYGLFPMRLARSCRRAGCPRVLPVRAA